MKPINLIYTLQIDTKGGVSIEHFFGDMETFNDREYTFIKPGTIFRKKYGIKFFQRLKLSIQILIGKKKMMVLSDKKGQCINCNSNHALKLTNQQQIAISRKELHRIGYRKMIEEALNHLN